MTKENFKTLLHQQGFENIEVSDGFLRKMQIVIDFYPGIDCMEENHEEEAVVFLVGTFGKRIIGDMYSSAKERKRLLEERRRKTKEYAEAIRKIDGRLRELERGEE